LAHARCNVSEIADLEIRTDGRSSRVETVTIGKNPSRQIVLYDKRSEIIAQKKLFWILIWNTECEPLGFPPLDITDRSKSGIWRVEVRAFKRHLKDRWNVTTWGHLREQLPDILSTAFKEILYLAPTTDSNRARWPNHPIWDLAAQAASGKLNGLASMVDPTVIADLIKQERAAMFDAQIKGCFVGLAGLNGVEIEKLFSYIMGSADRMVREMSKDELNVRKKLEHAKIRYGA
jgi:hypothetical protein